MVITRSVHFDRRFFNAASTGLVGSGYLRGDEEVLLDNASPRGRLAFHLPGQLPPQVTVTLRGTKDISPQMRLDTVILDTDEQHLLLLWRGHVPLPTGLHDVGSVVLRAEGTVAKSGPQ